MRPRTRRGRMAVLPAVLLAIVGATMAHAQPNQVEPPSRVSGSLGCGAYWQDAVVENVVLGPLGDGNLVRRERRGFHGRYTVNEVDDPRLDGTYTASIDSDEYIGPEPFTGDHLIIERVVIRVENEDGSWQGTGARFHLPETWEPVAPRWEPMVLIGGGAYEGLSALLETRVLDPDCYCWSFGWGQSDRCEFELRGVIVPGVGPPTPPRRISRG